MDERRGATPQELRRMADAFSRSGFTHGYFTKQIDSSMLGIRREQDKQISKGVERFGGLQKKVPLSVEITLEAGKPAALTLSAGTHTVTVEGDLPQEARTAPMTEESVLRSVCRFGGTPYEAVKAKGIVGEGLMLPVSRLNDLRRRGVEALEAQQKVKERGELPMTEARPLQKRIPRKTARFYRAEQITHEAKSYFDRIFLPLHQYDPKADGVTVPPVIFDGGLEEIRRELKKAKSAGARYAMIGNLGHLELVREADLIPVGDLRLNVTNGETAGLLESLGLEEILLSPELTLPQMRDVGGNSAAVVYGRLPLMLLEKCVIKELSDCKSCSRGDVKMVDRKGISFPILREWEHRNVVYNSLPTAMSDREELLIRHGIVNRHFIFSTESPQEVDRVISAHRRREPLGGLVRRM